MALSNILADCIARKKIAGQLPKQVLAGIKANARKRLSGQLPKGIKAGASESLIHATALLQATQTFHAANAANIAALRGAVAPGMSAKGSKPTTESAAVGSKPVVESSLKPESLPASKQSQTSKSIAEDGEVSEADEEAATAGTPLTSTDTSWIDATHVAVEGLLKAKGIDPAAIGYGKAKLAKQINALLGWGRTRGVGSLSQDEALNAARDRLIRNVEMTGDPFTTKRVRGEGAGQLRTWHALEARNTLSDSLKHAAKFGVQEEETQAAFRETAAEDTHTPETAAETGGILRRVFEPQVDAFVQNELDNDPSLNETDVRNATLYVLGDIFEKNHPSEKQAFGSLAPGGKPSAAVTALRNDPEFRQEVENRIYAETRRTFTSRRSWSGLRTPDNAGNQGEQASSLPGPQGNFRGRAGPGPAVAGSPPPAATVPVAMEGRGDTAIPDIISSFEEVIRSTGDAETPVRIGRFRQRFAGVFKNFPEVARIKNAGDFATASHEVAHSLQKQSFGSIDSAALSGLPVVVRNELEAVGRTLYAGSATRPASGYQSEGFADFLRLYLTTDAAASIAPKVNAWFTNDFLPIHQATADALQKSKALIDTWRQEGALNRAKAQMPEPPSRFDRMKETVREYLGVVGQIEEFKPLKDLVDEAERVSGGKLEGAQNPYELASSKRGASGATVYRMVFSGMVDPFGNNVGPSLQEAIAPVADRQAEFSVYLWARRGLELINRGMDPGMSQRDAEYLVNKFNSPEFQMAAVRVYDWQDQVLEYVKTSNPAMAEAIDRIRATSLDYVPLQRVIDSKGAKSLASKLAANPLTRIKGSGRQVKPIFDQIIQNTHKLVSQSNRQLVLQSLVDLSKHEGLGFLVEEVPADMVRNAVHLDAIRPELEALGLDTTAVPDEVLTFFTKSLQPKGVDPVIAVKGASGLKFYQVPGKVYDLLEGLEMHRLNPIADIFFGMPARAFRLGTTGLRASFSLFTNPSRDFQTFVMQSRASSSPTELLGAYLQSLGEVTRAGLGGRESPSVALFHQLAVSGAQPLGIDVDYTRRAVKTVFSKSKARRIIASPIEFVREVFSITEAAPRVAEIKLMAKKIGYDFSRPMTSDEATILANAGKRVTVDFSAGGKYAKTINQGVPFYNATIQGSRSFARVVRENPARAVIFGIATLTLPALLNWWKNKDEEWYRNLPWRERFLYTNIKIGDNVLQIPRPQEWGNVFMVLPEALADWAYRNDPEVVKEAMGHVVATTFPGALPVIPAAALEQARNKLSFFNRPIVPRSQVDLPPGEQYSEFTSELSKALGRAFPNHVSPRRMDTMVRQVFGGVGGDLLQGSNALLKKLGIKEESPHEPGWEPADLAVMGRAFRRGGIASSVSQPVIDFYEDYSLYTARHNAKDEANKLKGKDLVYYHALTGTRARLKVLGDVAQRTANSEERRRVYGEMSAAARKTLEKKP